MTGVEWYPLDFSIIAAPFPFSNLVCIDDSCLNQLTDIVGCKMKVSGS